MKRGSGARHIVPGILDLGEQPPYLSVRSTVPKAASVQCLGSPNLTTGPLPVSGSLAVWAGCRAGCPRACSL